MSILYHPSKATVVADALRMLSVGSTCHVEEGKKEFDKEVYKLSCMIVYLLDSTEEWVMVINKKLNHHKCLK